MEALKIAFDAVVVGALALPWVALCFYLFMGEANASKTWQMVRDYHPQIPSTLGAVLLFVVAYLLGSAVSRVSGDFFNDEDLKIPITENSIRESVYCATDESQLVVAARKHFSMKEQEDCKSSEARKSDVTQLFQLQQAAVLLQGTDKIEQLNQLRAQILVLRGGAFDGIVFAVFCLFGWCAHQSTRRSWIVPMLFLAVGTVASVVHLRSHKSEFDDPPFMEFAFLFLGSAGLSVVGGGNAPKRPYGRYLLLSVLLTAIAYFGWWWSEILYDRQVLHMFAALNPSELK